MTLLHEFNRSKVGNDLLAFESQIDEAIVLMNSIIGNLQTLKTSLENDVDYSQDDVNAVQDSINISVQKIKDYGNSL